ncbi:hypothetical protein HYH02_006134 [Chlamydomonas schloesseri]|uniref:Phosphatidate cytidylyltransferase, mitochondrial n=1 Tax=Chlamydomonas schloesseri TaxID=2026947 RepID=A0A835WJL0_9CHLO|nr:hypothetical protein HYH02_006134 [Chlamydomonas schloesseri]|eukprot:KAG2448782.1 hypothetical protein HYH02_006134 [Chlamydomonas schloesseri]
MSTPLQSAARQATASPALTRVLAHFPEVSYAFAYGSGAHHQPGLYDATEPLHSPSGTPSTSSDESAARAESGGAGAGARPARATLVAPAGGKGSGKGPVLDFIFAVEDSHKWHEENLKRNQDHYSWVGRLGSQAVCSIAEAVGVGVHFNTLVPLDAQTTIKYGVVERACLERDLRHWTHLYIAGRMQKPVTPLLQAPQSLAEAEVINRHNALSTALVLLPPTFTEEELLRTLVGLSYRGDVRLAVGAEDPHKVGRIVAGSWEALAEMYLPLLQSERYRSLLGLEVAGETAGGQRGATLWRQAKDKEAQVAALQQLPAGLLHEMAARLGFHLPLEHLHAGEPTQREVVAAVLRTGQPQRLAADSLAAIVRRSSMYQAASGLLAAGGGKAVTYVAAKLGKALRPVVSAASQQAAQAQAQVAAGVQRAQAGVQQAHARAQQVQAQVVAAQQDVKQRVERVQERVQQAQQQMEDRMQERMDRVQERVQQAQQQVKERVEQQLKEVVTGDRRQGDKEHR